ncbi:Ger(x)C family spore germination protein [Clostridium sp. JS66]|uniref:Ger(x)C family spore germination protein n=1 Tax=Clostridium sp. JS66 TaxID=3064705 RepID=UPI00298D90C6|nr:Ger(x)C family spore germination protein [Clostridium sp. JS66]WPC41678.1 Ger(x)C family spore germination protein [Clostridium sp. JS66]
MKKTIFFLIIIIPCILSGCWDSVETEKLGVVTLLGIESSGNNDIKVTVQEASGKNQSSSNQYSAGSDSRSFNTYSEVSNSITNAIQKISSNQHKDIYFGHTKVIILDEKLVTSKGIQFVIEFYEKIPEMRLRTWILISKSNQLDKILNSSMNLDIDTGSAIEETIRNENDNSYLTVNNLKDFIEMLNTPGSQAYTSGIAVSPKTSGSKTSNDMFVIKDTAVFKSDKLIGWMKNEESRGLSFASGNVRGGFMDIPFGDNAVSLKIVKTKLKISPLIINEKMQINLNLDIVSNISGSRVKCDFMNTDTIEKLQQIQSEKAKREITLAISRSKDLNSDVFQFGNYFNMEYPTYWKKIKNNWNFYYPNVQVNINVNSAIRNIGSTYRTLK